VKKVVQLPSHPLAGVGGHAMPVSGRIGGAKGVGIADPAAAAAADAQKVRVVQLNVRVSRVRLFHWCW
jgi:hypothetical protein